MGERERERGVRGRRREVGRDDDSEMGREKWRVRSTTTKGVKIAFHREEQKDRDNWNIPVLSFVNV